MSFILDAIKKSENERQKNRQPDIHSLQGSNVYQAGRRSIVSRLLVLVLAIVLLVLISWWLWPKVTGQFGWQIQRVPTNTHSGTQSPADVESAGGSEEGSVVNAAPPQAQTKAIDNNAAVVNSAAESAQDTGTVLPPRHLIKEFWELPADFQSTVPELNFSFHVFSENPKKRTIIINDRSLKEGQTVAAGLKLHVITSTGVILHYRDRYFHIDVVEKW